MQVVRALGALLFVAGLAWSVMFPKTNDVLRPDFVLSVALGVGLIGGGLLLATAQRRPLPITVLTVLLAWSLLANVGLCVQLRALAQFELQRLERNGSGPR